MYSLGGSLLLTTESPRHLYIQIAAVEQVAQRGHPASEVAERLGVSIHSLYAWVKRYGASFVLLHLPK